MSRPSCWGTLLLWGCSSSPVLAVAAGGPRPTTTLASVRRSSHNDKEQSLAPSSSWSSLSLRRSLWDSPAMRLRGGGDDAARGLGSWFRSWFRKTDSSLSKRYQEEQLSTVRVETVRISSRDTVIPPPLLEYAVRQSGLLGEYLQEERVQKCASIVNRWYQVAGYPLHSMTGAILDPTTSTAILTVKEPKLSNPPVALSFRKGVSSKTKKKKKNEKKQGTEEHDDSATTTSVVEAAPQPETVPGRTRPDAIARALRLRPGQHFRWNMNRWYSVSHSGLFSQIHSATPQVRLASSSSNDEEEDAENEVQFQMQVTEATSRSLDYGLSRSLYTGAWEGEFNANHRNLWGSGETVGISIRKGAPGGGSGGGGGGKSAKGKGKRTDKGKGTDKDSSKTTTSTNALYKTPPTIRLSYTNDKFHLGNGYDVELFAEGIGDDDVGGIATPPPAPTNDAEDPDVAKSSAQVAAEAAQATLAMSSSSSSSAPQCRRGATLRIKDVTWGPRLGSFLSSLLASSPQARQQRWMQSLMNPDSGDPQGIISTVSTSIEQTTSSPLAMEVDETMGSVTVGFRPLCNSLGGRLRSSIETSMSVGTKVLSLSSSSSTTTATSSPVPRGGSEANDLLLDDDWDAPPLFMMTSAGNFLPYASATVTSRQILPLSTKQRPTELALEHVLGASTEHLPRHEARAMGIASKLRGYSTADAKSKPLQSYLRGTAELRFPVSKKLLTLGVPKPKTTSTETGQEVLQADAAAAAAAAEEEEEDGSSGGLSLVMFGDWAMTMAAHQDEEEKDNERKGSVGIGLHQSLQGIPIKCELCMTSQHRKLGVFVSLGNSFDVVMPP